MWPNLCSNVLSVKLQLSCNFCPTKLLSCLQNVLFPVQKSSLDRKNDNFSQLKTKVVNASSKNLQSSHTYLPNLYYAITLNYQLKGKMQGWDSPTFLWSKMINDVLIILWQLLNILCLSYDQHVIIIWSSCNYHLIIVWSSFDHHKMILRWS